mmetsp:Transcript_26494/g.57810  ORF Transcript_26494/g.57810 Transcript_26494/m.57810 type:complete len:204 (+) Transcript_26494:116-727(+)|eukprot:CAMPEP_0202901424 /NCGR_PEP_ID=MMETSP1392-20130828/14245_1 /ASSEMBLY_ACC=CAM_ASM_000868 /TAXON_ID=225041 /ORGANISM="Chlamydomonas chlamydogama, Strain SAG 11-48b" /LENGTH=203 /DNA_ID=CAMNT_0049587981 /DNA_START=87 /DNA_END=698 /DNA_ORIENTATION=+
MATASLARVGKLLPSTSALFVCDVQERFRPVIHHFPSVIDTARRMIRGANTLGLPVVITEQYPKALGNTCVELVEALPPSHRVIQKTLFSMVTPEVEEELGKMPDVKQVLLLGIEAHVCVLQTTLDLLERGYEVHLLVDGVSSQRAHDRAVGLQRVAQAGAFLSTSEMVLFQLMRDAKHKEFKAISALVKEPRADPIKFTPSL